MTQITITKTVIAAAMAISTGLAQAHAAPLSSWTGVWENSGSGLQKVVVKNNGGTLTISAEGKCTPTNCKWGTVPATAFAPNVGTPIATDTRSIMATFKPSHAKKTMILEGVSDDRLRVRILTDFTDGSNRSDFVSIVNLKKRKRPVMVATPILPFKEDCIGLNPANVTVANPNGSWKLVEGNHWILDAGPNKSEMERAKYIVQKYGFTKQCFIGRPYPSVTYWLKGKAAPKGGIAREDCVNINPNNLTVKKNGSRYNIVSNGNHLAFIAETKAEAQKGIKAIKYYGFTKSCFVGRPNPSMKYLRK